MHYIKGDVHREHLFAGFAREFMTFIARYAPGPELVEIGSGLGLLLVEAQRRGFAARGLEVNTNQVALMRARGLHVVESTLEQAALPPGSVDVVCMSHVLEHIQDMHSLLCAVHRVLKPGGVLAVSQPHYAAPLPRLIGHLWLGWDWQRHVWHFDVPTLTRVLSTHGLMCLAVEYNAMYHSWVPHPFSWRPKVLAVEVLKAALSRAEPWFGYGDQFFLAARRAGMV
jgi:SAM-dependent methyltransferase